MKIDEHKIGNVIRIIDNQSLIINVGKSDIDIGDTIKVYESLDELKDLDGTTLAIFEYTKDELEVIDVEESYSVCRKTKTETVPSSMQLAISPLFTKEKIIPLNVDPEDIDPLDIKDEKIRIGDPVKLA